MSYVSSEFRRLTTTCVKSSEWGWVLKRLYKKYISNNLIVKLYTELLLMYFLYKRINTQPYSDDWIQVYGTPLGTLLLSSLNIRLPCFVSLYFRFIS